MPSTRTIALTATSVLAIVAAGVIGATAGSRGGESDAAGTPTSAITSAPSGSTSSTAPTAPASSGSPGASGSSGPSGSSTEGGVASDAPGAGSEILPSPAEPTSTATGYHLPAISTTEPAPMFDGMPTPATAKGRLVAGFPAALAPPSGTRVESSSVSVASDMLQAALVATGGDADAVLAHYRQVLSARGFAEQRTQGVENAPAAAFTRGRNNVTITIQDGKTYVLANLRPKDA
jgi:hypothetical protein